MKCIGNSKVLLFLDLSLIRLVLQRGQLGPTAQSVARLIADPGVVSVRPQLCPMLSWSLIMKYNLRSSFR